ncbi:MAG: hypothetical protein U5J63_02475 [Fodinibius sp.]|nr:hypothetical protein [Fodinibius sp.]
MKYVQAGKISGDSLRLELQKWSNLFWEVYNNNSGTIASQLGARESIRILEGFDDQKMMTRIREVQQNDMLSDLGATYGKTYIANNQGLGPAISYLDSLSQMTEATDKVKRIDMEQIKLLYDSARVKMAKEKLAAFKENYPNDKSSADWVESMTYDLNYLSRVIQFRHLNSLTTGRR